MKRILPIPLLLMLVVLALQSCKPGQMAVSKTASNNCVTSAELSSLNVGMSKSQVVETLGGTYPYDVLAGDFDGCEVYQYKYKKPKKKTKASDTGRTSLTEGLRMFVDEQDAYLLFREGKLEVVMTTIGKGEVMNIIRDAAKIKEACAESDLRGCTDEEALNFKEDAIMEDGTCEYCPSYYQINPEFNPKRPVSDCNPKCIPIRTEEVVDGVVVVTVAGVIINHQGSSKTCSDCDIIETLANSKANVNVTLDLSSGSGTSSRIAGASSATINRTSTSYTETRRTTTGGSKVSNAAKSASAKVQSKKPAAKPAAKKPTATSVAKESTADTSDDEEKRKPRIGRAILIILGGIFLISLISG